MSAYRRPVIAACFNEPYVPHLATMLQSLAASGSCPLRCYLVADESVTSGVMGRLETFVAGLGLDAVPLSIPDHLIAGFADAGRYPRVAWYRAVLPDVLAEESRLLYLDCDLIVLHDLGALWETSLETGHLFGAVSHPSYAEGSAECARLGLPAKTPLLNSGVMLMDLAGMREEGFAAHIREYVTGSGRHGLRYADQDAMNAVYAGRWTRLDPVWNVLSAILLPFVSGASWADDEIHDTVTLERAARSPAVVHFDGSPVLRPWNRRCFNPFADLYRRYRAMTPWPLAQLEGTRQDAMLARLPPRLQARIWQARRLQKMVVSRRHPG